MRFLLLRLCLLGFGLYAPTHHDTQLSTQVMTSGDGMFAFSAAFYGAKPAAYSFVAYCLGTDVS